MTFKEESMNLKVDEDGIPCLIQSWEKITRFNGQVVVYKLRLFTNVVLDNIVEYWVTTVTKDGRVFDIEKAERYIQRLRKDL